MTTTQNTPKLKKLNPINRMKTWVLTAMIIFLLAQGIVAQHLMLSPMIEKTISGYEFGSSINYRLKGLFSVGAFYQTNIRKNYTEALSPFYGLLISAPLRKCEQMAFHANTRIGIVNGKFLVIAPGVETEIRVSEHFRLGVGLVVRKGFLAANANIKIIL